MLTRLLKRPVLEYTFLRCPGACMPTTELESRYNLPAISTSDQIPPFEMFFRYPVSCVKYRKPQNIVNLTMTIPNQDPKTSKIKAFLRKAMYYVVGYLLYAVTMAALIFLLFRIRLDVILIADLLRFKIWEIRGIVNISLVVIGILMFILVGFSEDRLRKSIEENRMWKVLLRIYIGTGAAWALWTLLYYISVWIILR